MSVANRHDGVSALLTKWAKLFMEEEAMNLAFLFMMIFCGPMIRYLFYICLAMYSFVELC